MGIGVKKGKLFGEFKEYPVFSFRFLFIGVHWIKGNGLPAFREAIRGLSSDKDWMIKNCKSVRIERKKAKVKANSYFENKYKDDVKFWENLYIKERQDNQTKTNEIYRLTQALKTIKGISND